MWFHLLACVLYCAQVSALNIDIKHTHERLLCPPYLPFVLTLAWSRAGTVDSFSLAWTHFQGDVSPLYLLLHFLFLALKCTFVKLFFSVQDEWSEWAVLCDVCCCFGRWPRRVSWVRVKSFRKERGRGGQCGYRIKLSSLCHYVFLPALFFFEVSWNKAAALCFL